jgi:hypothetical protein
VWKNRLKNKKKIFPFFFWEKEKQKTEVLYLFIVLTHSSAPKKGEGRLKMKQGKRMCHQLVLW